MSQINSITIKTNKKYHLPKTIVITGASSGIGKATVLHFARQGWNVVATIRKNNHDKDFQRFPTISLYELDAADEKAIRRVCQKIVKRYGQIDVVVNNAGYGTFGAFEASTPKQIQAQFEVNVFGLMNISRFFIEHFRLSGGGHIINVTSMGGRLTFPLYSAYHASKWAVEGFSESLIYELRPFNIHVKIIEPGLVKTNFNNLSKVIFNKEGLNAYDEYEHRTATNYRKSYEGAVSPKNVAETIFKAANDTSRKLRYVVGKPAPLLLALRMILPERLYFAIIQKQLSR